MRTRRQSPAERAGETAGGAGREEAGGGPQEDLGTGNSTPRERGGNKQDRAKT